MRNNKKFVKRRYILDPHCPVCGVKMVLSEDLPRNGKQIKVFPDNTCTIDHTYPKFDIRRLIEPHINTIMCRKCNHEKALQDEENFKNEFFNLIYLTI